MANRLSAVAVVAILSSLAACGQQATPKGQVVATVGGSEITSAELQAEIGGRVGSDAASNKAIQQQALQSIINRRILVAVAKDQKIERTPQGVIARRKAVELSLIGLLQAKMRSVVPKPSREEALGFVNDNAANFAQRRLVIVDQVIAADVPPAIIKQMEPLNTLDPIVALLDANRIKHNTTVGVVDTVTIDGAAAKKLSELKIGEVFLTPQGNILRISRIRDSVLQPVAGDVAVGLALDMLQTRREQAQISEQITNLLKAGQAKVKLNTDFSLPPAAK